MINSSSSLQFKKFIFFSLLTLIWLPWHTHASEFDGNWNAQIICGENFSNGRPGFRSKLEFEIINGSIDKQVTATTQLGQEKTLWKGTVNDGVLSLTADSKRENGDTWFWSLSGRTDKREISLNGDMLNPKKTVLRKCTITLRPIPTADASTVAPLDTTLVSNPPHSELTSEPLATESIPTPVSAKEPIPVPEPTRAPPPLTPRSINTELPESSLVEQQSTASWISMRYWAPLLGFISLFALVQFWRRKRKANIVMNTNRVDTSLSLKGLPPRLAHMTHRLSQAKGKLQNNAFRLARESFKKPLSTYQRFIASDTFQSLQVLFSKGNSFHLSGTASNWIAFVIFYFLIFLVGSSVIIAILKTFTSIPFYFLDPLWLGCILTWLIGLILIVSKKARGIMSSYKIGAIANRFLLTPIYWGILSDISPLRVKLQRSCFLVFSILVVMLLANWVSLPSATVKRAGEQMIRSSLNRDACTWILNNLRLLSSMKIAGIDKEEQREWVIANGRSLELIRRDGRPFHVSPTHITFFHMQVNNNHLPQQFQSGETETQCMSLK